METSLIEFAHLETTLIKNHCRENGNPKPKKQDLVNCAFVLANQKLNELLNKK
jgi:hypothetical protein